MNEQTIRRAIPANLLVFAQKNGVFGEAEFPVEINGFLVGCGDNGVELSDVVAIHEQLQTRLDEGVRRKLCYLDQMPADALATKFLPASHQLKIEHMFLLRSNQRKATIIRSKCPLSKHTVVGRGSSSGNSDKQSDACAD